MEATVSTPTGPTISEKDKKAESLPTLPLVMAQEEASVAAIS
jgi:hypothetical protein